jgi:hypothetical protein
MAAGIGASGPRGNAAAGDFGGKKIESQFGGEWARVEENTLRIAYKHLSSLLLNRD